MLIRHLDDCTEIIAGDRTCLRELLHPDRDYRFSRRFSLAHAVIAPGKKSVRHRLGSDEVYFIIRGEGRLHIDNESTLVAPGDTIDIPPGSIQWIENTGDEDLAILCIVDPAWRLEDEEVL